MTKKQVKKHKKLAMYFEMATKAKTSLKQL